MIIRTYYSSGTSQKEELDYELKNEDILSIDGTLYLKKK